ncbi:PKD-like domain-containing protein [Algoriphagus halophytocola]
MSRNLPVSILFFLLIVVGWEAYGQTVSFSPDLADPEVRQFTVPAGVTSITVEVWGGGGRGGTRRKSDGNGETGGGGGGGYSRSIITVSPGQVIDYYVGFGSTTQEKGEDSWFLSNTTLLANGGNSVADGASSGATGGAIGIGDITYRGGDGANAGSNFGGGGGSSAGINAHGSDANNSSGGSAQIGGGNGGNGKTGDQGDGVDGANPGGGGGGVIRKNSSETDIKGGNGGNGQIRISYIALTSATGTDNQTVCEDDPITTISYSFPPNSTNVSVSNLPNGLTASSPNLTAGTISISGIPLESGTFTISATPPYNSFFTLTKTGTVTVILEPDVTDMSETICSEETFTATPMDGTNGFVPSGTTYTWGAPAMSGGLTGGAAGSGTSISGTLTNTTNTVQTATYTVTPSVNGCIGPDFTVTVTVDPVATITDFSETICTTDSFTIDPANGTDGIIPSGTTYSWNAPIMTGGVIGGVAGSGNTISGTLSNPTNIPGTATYTITPTSGSCTGEDFTVTITVNPENTATPVGSEDQSQCINEALVDITFNTTGATGISNDGADGANGLPPGVTATWNSGVITISGTPSSTTNSPYNYSIPLTGGCGTVFATGTITVFDDNTVSPNTAVDQPLCIDTPLSPITFTTTGATGIVDDGIDGANGLPPGLSATWAGNIITISGSPTEHVNSPYNYSIPLLGGCNDLFAEGTITVNRASEITSENMADQRICDGANFSELSITAVGTGTLNYQWFSNGSPSKTGATMVGSNSPNYTPPSASIGTTYYYVEVSSDCSPIATSSFMEATVEPTTVITTEIDNTGEVECYGDGFLPLTVVADGADLTYQWYTKTDNLDPVTNPGTPVSGATSATFTPPSTTPEFDSYYYYVVVTGFCGVETSIISGEYIVLPPATYITLDPSTADVETCKDGIFPELEVAAIGETDPIDFPDILYQWYSNSFPNNTGGTPISGATSPTYTPSSSTVGTLYYYATAASECGTVPSDVSGAFTVNQPSVVTSESLSAQEICEDNTFTPISVVADGHGTINYQWYSNTSAVADTLGANVVEISGANSDSFTPPTTLGTLYYFVKVSSDCGENVLSGPSGAFTVNPLPVPTLTSDVDFDPFVCVGTPVTYTTESGQTNYIWEFPGQVLNTDYTVTSGGTSSSNSVTITWLSDGAKDVSIYYTDPNGCTADTPIVNSITVDPLPVPILTSSIDADPFVCEGSSVSYTTDSGQDNYTWSFPGQVENTDYIITSGGTSTSNTATITWLTDGNKDVTISYTDANGCSPSTPTTNTITIDPLPIPTFTSSPGSDTCAEIDEVTYTTQPGQSNYIWSIPGVEDTDYEITGGGIGATDSSVSILWISDGSKTVEVSYTDSSTGCVAASPATSTTEVEALATVGPTSNPFPSVCISEPTLQPFTQPTTGITSIGSATGLPPGVNAVFNSSTGEIEFNGDVTGATPGLYNYSIPLIGNCTNGLTATGSIDVTPTYELTSVSSASATVSGGSASITINGNLTTLPDGEYEVSYSLDDGTNPPIETTSPSFFVNNGRGTFSTDPLDIEDVDVYTLTIKNIRKITDVCTIDLYENDPINTTYFSVCGAPFNIDGTFHVPAGIYEITIQAFAAGSTGETGTITIPVRPGQPLGVFVGQSGTTGIDRDTWVTLDSSDPDPESSALIYLTGTGGVGNGQVLISYTCPDPNEGDCFEVIDDGGISGTTIIRFTCDYDWQIPEGLVEFSVYAVGGGGGGGMGDTGGGGGGGGFTSMSVFSNNPFGIAAGNSLNIDVGDGGEGAETVNKKGENGESTMVSASIPDVAGNITINLNAQGGGGGGSYNNVEGLDGASGGGGAYGSSDNAGSGGEGEAGQGNSGGNGGSAKKGGGGSSAGGGGGGAGVAGTAGTGSGVGNSQGGEGGEGSTFLINGNTYGYGAGGGGIGFNDNSNNNGGKIEGSGGEVNGVVLGGNAGPNSIGGNGTDYTGSGGGAGNLGGGSGGQGVVYITYFNYRILEVSYLYFNAEYNLESRSGELTWATSQEWGNDRFEIERALASDLSSWTKIGEVKGQGYSDSPTYYSFEDLELPASGGNILYRLKQIDTDESFSYSVTRSIQVKGLKGQTSWIVYPNPSSPGTYVTVDLLDRSSYRDEPIFVKIADVIGTFETYSVRSIEEVSIAVNNYLEQAAPGIHIVQLTWGKHTEQLKILRR